MKTHDDLRAPPQRPEPPLQWRPGKALLALPVVLLALFLAVLLRPWDRGAAPSLVLPEAPATTAPAPVDVAAAVRALADLSYQLRIHPDPARVADYLDIENPGLAEATDSVQKLAAGALRYDPLPQPFTISGVHVLAQGPDTATVAVDFAGWPAFRVVDAKGAAVLDTPAAGDRTVVWKLHLRDGRWRIASTETVR